MSLIEAKDSFLRLGTLIGHLMCTRCGCALLRSGVSRAVMQSSWDKGAALREQRGWEEGVSPWREKLPEMAAIRPGTGVAASLDPGPEPGRARSPLRPS